ncbi:MAG TPA: hypothetical protein VHY34_05410 [Caulobacteraceae bacterium]|jgi:Tfp pilus assembly protein FimT|nr:hypothetical protein [Caulobacteraceae bacterium]
MSETGDDGSRLSPEAGTTLIEALVVVAITTMVAIIGFPRLQQGLVTLSQRLTVATVAARLREARADAMRRDGPVVFTVAADGKAFGASDGPAATTPPAVRLKADGGRRIAFYGDGSSSGGVIWVSAARQAIAVTVAPRGGGVSVNLG